MAEEILAVENIVKRFGGLIALRGVSINVKKGEIIGIMGPNGSGKTTLINVISGVYTPEEGRIYFEGTDVTRMPLHKRARMGILRTFQIPRPFRKLNVIENVVLAVKNNPKYGHASKDAYAVAKELLAFVGLERYAGAPVTSLNTFMLKKLDLARALALSPKLLMIDEIVAGLTEIEAIEISRLIKEINSKGTTLIVVEHVIPFLAKICGRIIVLSEGNVIAEGAPEEVVSNPIVISSYIG
jgi:branched-chain amino acid transport system ATP-binding protein